MARPLSAKPRAQRGLAVVETAIVLPVFLFLMLATAELGRALYHYNILTKSVRDGAQYLARYGVTPAGVIDPTAAEETVARNLVVFGSPVVGTTPLLPGLAVGNIAITPVTRAPSTSANYVQVTATYAYVPMLVPIPGFGAADDVNAPGTLTASAVMRGL